MECSLINWFFLILCIGSASTCIYLYVIHLIRPRSYYWSRVYIGISCIYLVINFINVIMYIHSCVVFCSSFAMHTVISIIIPIITYNYYNAPLKLIPSIFYKKNIRPNKYDEKQKKNFVEHCCKKCHLNYSNIGVCINNYEFHYIDKQDTPQIIPIKFINYNTICGEWFILDITEKLDILKEKTNDTHCSKCNKKYPSNYSHCCDCYFSYNYSGDEFDFKHCVKKQSLCTIIKDGLLKEYVNELRKKQSLYNILKNGFLKFENSNVVVNFDYCEECNLLKISKVYEKYNKITHKFYYKNNMISIITKSYSTFLNKKYYWVKDQFVLSTKYQICNPNLERNNDERYQNYSENNFDREDIQPIIHEYCENCDMEYNIDYVHCCKCKINSGSDHYHCLKCHCTYEKNMIHCCKCKKEYDPTMIHCCKCKKEYDPTMNHCCECEDEYDPKMIHCCECKDEYDKDKKHCCKCYKIYDFDHCNICHINYRKKYNNCNCKSNNNDESTRMHCFLCEEDYHISQLSHPKCCNKPDGFLCNNCAGKWSSSCPWCRNVNKYKEGLSEIIPGINDNNNRENEHDDNDERIMIDKKTRHNDKCCIDIYDSE